MGFERNEFSDILITTIILEKIDRETRKQFELAVNTSDVPKFNNLMTFLEKRSQIMESIKKNVIKSKQKSEVKQNFLFIRTNRKEIVYYIMHHILFLNVVNSVL